MNVLPHCLKNVSRRDILLVAPGGAKISHARMDDEAQPEGKKDAPHHPREMNGLGSRLYSRGREGRVICDFRYAISDFRSGGKLYPGQNSEPG